MTPNLAKWTLTKSLALTCLSLALLAGQAQAQNEAQSGTQLQAQAKTEASQYQALFNQGADNAALLALSKKLNLGETVRGQFVQSRQLKVLKKPLVSRGQFIFDKEKGLIWQQLAPFESLLMLKDKQLIQRDSQGRVQVSQSDANAGAAAMGDLLPNLVRAMLSGDVSGLAQNFELHLLTLDEKQWQLGLTPKDATVKKAIANMVLAGSDKVESLVLMSSEPSVTVQDLTRIDFSELIQGALNEAEAAQFSLVTESPQPSSLPSPDHK
ncbi:outer membrane lipoprotein carrier protein LolA [Shewanella sp. A25]|nr:outer membrane lipoprotein carrier protein LolA [Shewanella shenzhenensis]